MRHRASKSFTEVRCAKNKTCTSSAEEEEDDDADADDEEERARRKENDLHDLYKDAASVLSYASTLLTVNSILRLTYSSPSLSSSSSSPTFLLLLCKIE